ncbi:MAG: flavin monoamine oxidase family protein [Thermoanaerobaculia bacterium]
MLAVGLASWAGCGGARPRPATATGGSHDVIIVGAGVAGLTAAKELRKASRSVLVLEAQDRIGGRAHVDSKTFSVPIDYGAGWLHGVDKNPLVPLADKLGLHRVDTDLDGPIFVGDRLATDEEAAACGATWERLEAALEEAAGAGKDPSPAELIPSDAPCAELMLDNVGRFEAGAEIEDTSTIDAALFDSGNDDFIREGIGTFVAAYGKDVPVRLGAVVTRIEHGRAGVTVHLASGERFSGRRVLVTVSTGVLAAGKIAVDPPLPQWKLDAIAGLPMGLLNKIVMQFKSDIFGDTKPNSWTLWDGPGHDNIAFVIKPLSAPIAIAFYGAKQAAEFEQDDAAALAHAKDALKKMYGPRVDSEFEKSALTKWGQNPWTMGSYSAARPGASKMHAVMARPVDDRVFFAGEACARPVFNGSLAGAFESALDASRLLVQSLAGNQPAR